MQTKNLAHKFLEEALDASTRLVRSLQAANSEAIEQERGVLQIVIMQHLARAVEQERQLSFLLSEFKAEAAKYPTK